MTQTKTTLGQLSTGSVVAYSDMSNDADEYVILTKYDDQFGSWVDLLHKATNTVSPTKARTEIGDRWEIIAQN